MGQITDTVLMVKPHHFCRNEETAVNNYFQQGGNEIGQEEILKSAQLEFDGFVKALRDKGVNVIVVEDRPEVITPDSVFPNNWISFHANGDVTLFPMYANNRRLERRDDILDLLEDQGFEIGHVFDLTDAEREDKFLEGTGSMILDRENGIAYCALSYRSDEELFREFCELFGYRPVPFKAYQSVDGERKLIYHTNVVMTLGESFAVVCAEAIDDIQERERVINTLKRSEKEVILISEAQLASFAGNMLQVENNEGDRFLVMSSTAHNSLNNDQIKRLKQHTEFIVVDIPTIEYFGGGSARCMLAEVFLPRE